MHLLCYFCEEYEKNLSAGKPGIRLAQVLSKSPFSVCEAYGRKCCSQLLTYVNTAYSQHHLLAILLVDTPAKSMCQMLRRLTNTQSQLEIESTPVQIQCYQDKIILEKKKTEMGIIAISC